MDNQGRPIVFLHLPKTAGQSIRVFLGEAFPKRLIFPGQTDAHLALYSRQELSQYSIFSGHFSWSLIDCISKDAFVFSVLREPSQRIISFYKFLRREAVRFSTDELTKTQNAVIRFALENPIEVFLEASDLSLRGYIDSSFDNFYLYYFATRVYNGRSLIRDYYPPSDTFTTERILQIAIKNISEAVRIYDVVLLERLQQDLANEPGYIETKMPFTNRGSSNPGADLDLSEICDDRGRLQEQIHLRCQFDMRLYNTFT